MGAALYPPPRPQSVGEVLDAGFQIFATTLLGSLPYGVLAVLAGQLVNVHDLIAGRPLRGFGGTDFEWWAWYAAGMLLLLVVWGALWQRQATLAAGGASSARAELRRSVAVSPTLIGLTLITGGALALVAALGGGALALLGDPNALYLLVGVLLLPPALYLVVVYLFAFAAAVLCGMPAMRALLYGAALLRGKWWRTFLMLIVLAIVILVLYLLVGTCAALVLSVTGVPDVAVVTAVSAAAAMVMGAVSLPFVNAMLLAIFGELRIRLEGLDLERRIERALES
jgi:hypothetical protein